MLKLLKGGGKSRSCGCRCGAFLVFTTPGQMYMCALGFDTGAFTQVIERRSTSAGCFSPFRTSGLYSLVLIIAARRYSLRLPPAAFSN